MVRFSMMKTRPLPTDIRSRLDTLAEALAGDPRIRFAYLCGGAARRELTPLSDVDLAVYLDPADLDAELDVAELVARRLGTNEVDLVVLNHAPTALTGRLLRDRIVILDRDPRRRHRFESEALRTFHDFRLFERAALAERLDRG